MAETGPVRYRSPDEDSARWLGFRYREGDIVISTRSKSGTTWVQMICALLIFQRGSLPEPLSALSPWLDWLVTPEREVYARLAAQTQRRFIKTHTPLDGIPLDPRATYIVVGRHPLDIAVSLYHQGDNLDRELMARLTGHAARSETGDRLPLTDWVASWIDWEGPPQERLDSLTGVMWHLADAWARRTEPNVVLVHYDDLSDDLAGRMRRLADTLGISVPEHRWPELVEAATFGAMKRHADRLAPDPVGVLKDKSSFFRRGTSGERRALPPAILSRYRARASELAPPDLLRWLHGGRP